MKRLLIFFTSSLCCSDHCTVFLWTCAYSNIMCIKTALLSTSKNLPAWGFALISWPLGLSTSYNNKKLIGVPSYGKCSKLQQFTVPCVSVLVFYPRELSMIVSTFYSNSLFFYRWVRHGFLCWNFPTFCSRISFCSGNFSYFIQCIYRDSICQWINKFSLIFAFLHRVHPSLMSATLH